MVEELLNILYIFLFILIKEEICMKIVIVGGIGFVGKVLIKYFLI